MDSKQSERSGNLIANQGFTADQLTQETATRFEGIEDAGKAKVELVARNIAEIGYKDLYEGLAWFGQHFQDSELEFYLFGREMKVDPSSWKFESRTIAKVGTGAGDDQKSIQALSGILATIDGEIEKGSGLSDNAKKYNVYSELVQRSGLHGVENYYNDPTKPEQLLQAQNQQLTQMVQQLQQQMQMLQTEDPIAKATLEAEMIRAQAKIASDQQANTIKAQDNQEKNQLKAMDMQMKAQQQTLDRQQKGRQFIIEQRRQNQISEEQMIIELTKLELDHGQDIEGSLV
jgi:hypothetical protein